MFFLRFFQGNRVYGMIGGILSKKNFSSENYLVQKVMSLKQDNKKQKGSGLTKSDFQDYRISIRRLVEEIEKIRQMQNRRQQLLSSLDYNVSLQSCYQNVPKKYFDPNYSFEALLKNFSRKTAIPAQVEVNYYFFSLKLFFHK